MSKHDASRSYVEVAKRILQAELEDGPMEEWIRIVKGVLPQVPEFVIRHDLEITGNVDESITRLLDGTVVYEPEIRVKPNNIKKTNENKDQAKPASNDQTNAQTNQSAQSESNLISNMNAPSPMSFSTKASSFEKNPKERMRSYQERKKQLLEIARKHFIEKHGLQN